MDEQKRDVEAEDFDRRLQELDGEQRFGDWAQARPQPQKADADAEWRQQRR